MRPNMTDLTIGVIASGRIAAGLVTGHELAAPLCVYPPPEGAGSGNAEVPGTGDIQGMPMEAIAATIAHIVRDLSQGHGVPGAAGVGFPGIIRNGVIEESPNLKQAKGAKLAEMVNAVLRAGG